MRRCLWRWRRRRSDAWAEHTLGWVEDVGDLGRHWPAVGAAAVGGGRGAADGPGLVTFMNNIGTAEGPDGLKQYLFDRSTYTMHVEPWALPGPFSAAAAVKSAAEPPLDVSDAPAADAAASGKLMNGFWPMFLPTRSMSRPRWKV